MDEKTTQGQGTAGARNEGEGNKTAAREFDKAQHAFAQSGQVEGKAQEAKKALEGDERSDLERAEAVGKSHAAAEDPALKKR
jgi:hypothetical protein